MTFTVSCRNPSWSGGGRKSSTTSISSGSFVYLILLFIQPLPLSPVSGFDDADDVVPVRESNGHDAFAGPEPLKCRMDMEPPVKPDARGIYPVPIPGLTKLS